MQKVGLLTYSICGAFPTSKRQWQRIPQILHSVEWNLQQQVLSRILTVFPFNLSDGQRNSFSCPFPLNRSLLTDSLSWAENRSARALRLLVHYKSRSFFWSDKIFADYFRCTSAYIVDIILRQAVAVYRIISYICRE